MTNSSILRWAFGLFQLKRRLLHFTAIAWTWLLLPCLASCTSIVSYSCLDLIGWLDISYRSCWGLSIQSWDVIYFLNIPCLRTIVASFYWYWLLVVPCGLVRIRCRSLTPIVIWWRIRIIIGACLSHLHWILLHITSSTIGRMTWNLGGSPWVQHMLVARFYLLLISGHLVFLFYFTRQS